MTTTPQLVEKPKARLKAGLRRIALRPDQLAHQFIEAWPKKEDPEIPHRYEYGEHDFAWESFWEDIDNNWSEWSPSFVARGFGTGNDERWPKMFVGVTEQILQDQTDEDTGHGPWYPIIEGLEDAGYDIHEVKDEFWFPYWVNRVLPQHNEELISILAYHVDEVPEAQQWIDMHFSPPGIGGEIADEDDIVIAKKVVADAESVEDQKEMGRAFLKSDQFKNWFITSSEQKESPLPEDFSFADIVRLAAAAGIRLPDELLEIVIEEAIEAPDHTGAKVELPEIMPQEDLIERYLEEAKSADTDKVKEIISNQYSRTAESIVEDEAKYQASWRFRLNLSEGFNLDTHEESSYQEIGANIAQKLADGSLAPEDLVEAHKENEIFGSGGASSGDFDDVYDLMEDWETEIYEETIHYDDEDYARKEQEEREHQYWLEQRRNRTPMGNVYDEGDRVMWGDIGPLTVTQVHPTANHGIEYSLAKEDGTTYTRLGEANLTPAPDPQQEMEYPDTTTASILDEPEETLDPFIFDLSEDQTAPKIHDDVREKILEQLGKALVNPDAIRAVIFFGSAAAYQYDPDSDFDVTVVVDPSLTRQGEDILGLNREISDELFIAGHPVTYFFREDEYPIDGSDAIYDLIGNYWIRVPERSESALTKPDYEDTVSDAVEWAKVLDVQIGELRRDMIDYDKLSSAYQRASDDRKQELYDRVQQVISELNESVAALANESDQLHETRLKAFQEDLEENGEDVASKYLSRNWVPENVLYKVLERYRYTKLLKMMDKLNKEGLFDEDNQLKLEYNSPIKSAMDKLEDEIEPGDHMVDREKNKDVIVEDIHDAEEGYQYEIYKTRNDKGQLDEVEKLDLIMVDENPERLLPTENPEMKTAAAGGTGYGDYQEKITDTSGASMAGDVSGSHEPDIYPMDPDDREGAPVPSQEHEKVQKKNKELRHRNSVAMRRVNALATEAVGLIRMGMYKIQKKRKAQVDQNTGGDHNTHQKVGPNPGPYHPQGVAGNPLGGGYSVNETQQAEQPTGEASEEESLQSTRQQYDQGHSSKEFEEQQQANDLTEQYQLRMMGASVEEQKLKVIMGASTGADDPADSSVSQLESSEDGRLRSKTDETREVLLHERDEDAKGDNATFPKLDDQLKPRP